MKKVFIITEVELYKLYITENKTTVEIASLLKTSVATINRFLKKYNIKKDKFLKNIKISATINNRTEKEKLEYINKISVARKGKGLGIEPWNKGKTGCQIAWNKGLTMSEDFKQAIKSGIANMSEEAKLTRHNKLSRKLKGRQPWNLGLTYTLDPETIKHAKEKEIATKKLMGTFCASNLEEAFYNKLLGYFLEQDIYRQFFDIDRYPFSCDFYIKPLDLFIELNGNWTHGFRPFNCENLSCIQQLNIWQEKAISSDYYKNAIYTWTDLDVRKQEIALKNNLTYLVIYTEEEIDTFFKLLEE